VAFDVQKQVWAIFGMKRTTIKPTKTFLRLRISKHKYVIWFAAKLEYATCFNNTLHKKKCPSPPGQYFVPENNAECTKQTCAKCACNNFSPPHGCNSNKTSAGEMLIFIFQERLRVFPAKIKPKRSFEKISEYHHLT